MKEQENMDAKRDQTDSQFAGIKPVQKELKQSSEKDDTEIGRADYRKDEKWVQEYMEQFGTEPSFF